MTTLAQSAIDRNTAVVVQQANQTIDALMNSEDVREDFEGTTMTLTITATMPFNKAEERSGFRNAFKVRIKHDADEDGLSSKHIVLFSEADSDGNFTVSVKYWLKRKS